MVLLIRHRIAHFVYLHLPSPTQELLDHLPPHDTYAWGLLQYCDQRLLKWTSGGIFLKEGVMLENLVLPTAKLGVDPWLQKTNHKTAQRCLWLYMGVVQAGYFGQKQKFQAATVSGLCQALARPSVWPRTTTHQKARSLPNTCPSSNKHLMVSTKLTLQSKRCCQSKQMLSNCW